MIQVDKISANLERGEHGIWFAKKRSPISYPEHGNLQCLQIEAISFWFKHRNKCILEAMRIFPAEGAIFDVGSGNGYVSFALKNAGFDTVVIEPGFQGAMNAYARGLNPVICSTLEDAGFKDDSIPSVGLFDVLEHIKDDIGFLETIKNLLIPGGRLYITVPAYNFLWSVEDDHAGHHRRYTTKSLSTKLESVGFNINLSTYIFGPSPIPIFIFRSIPSRFGFKTTSDFRRNQKEHCRNNSLLGSLLNWALDKELRALRNRRTIPVGGSCFLVATSK